MPSTQNSHIKINYKTKNNVQAASVFHYAIECFEGMKAYVDKDGNVRMFRPDMNMKRMQSSAHRLQLPVSDSVRVLYHYHFAYSIQEVT